MATKSKQFRSAVTGKYVSAAYAKRYPHLTVSHSIKKKAKPMGEAYPKPAIKIVSRKNLSPMVRS